MQCPRCKSLRIQLGYKEKSILALLAGGNEFLCNNCGLEFRSLEESGNLKRKPATQHESTPNRRRAPRYKVHLPTMVSLADKNASTGKLVRSREFRGHCVTISKVGLVLSLTGARFDAREFVKTGRLLFVTITLPNGAIDAVVTTVSHERVETEKGTPIWFVRATITQMSEGDTALLLSDLERRRNEAPLFTRE